MSFKGIKGREERKYIYPVFSIYSLIYHLPLSVHSGYHLVSLSFSWIDFLIIPCKSGLLATHSLNLCLSANIIIFPSFFKVNFAGYRILL